MEFSTAVTSLIAPLGEIPIIVSPGCRKGGFIQEAIEVINVIIVPCYRESILNIYRLLLYIFLSKAGWQNKINHYLTNQKFFLIE